MKVQRNIRDYLDIIDLPHHVSPTRPPLSAVSRAAQFSPFAALTGYEDLIDETARFTEQKLVLDEEQKERLNRQLQQLDTLLSQQPTVTLVHFVPDSLKQGGACQVLHGIVKKLDPMEGTILFSSGECIRMENVYSLQYDGMENE